VTTGLSMVYPNSPGIHTEQICAFSGLQSSCATCDPAESIMDGFHPEHTCLTCLYICIYMGMGQYLLIPFLVRWTSIYQLFWCSPWVQGFDTLPYIIYGSHVHSRYSHHSRCAGPPGQTLSWMCIPRIGSVVDPYRNIFYISKILPHIYIYNTVYI